MRINPSAQGWVSKFFSSVQLHREFECFDDVHFYNKRRETGFIYGHIVSFDSKFAEVTDDLSKDEKSKIALLNILFKMYLLRTESPSTDDFVKQLVAFYELIDPSRGNLFFRYFSGTSLHERIEKLIDNRIQTNYNFIGKNFSNILTNTLLFMDILAFDHFLSGKKDIQDYLTQLEATLLMVVAAALNAKMKKTNHDELIAKMFESSVRYTKFSDFSRKEALNFKDIKMNTLLEKLYLLDLVAMTIYSDTHQDDNETEFVVNVGQNIGLSEEMIATSLTSVQAFIHQYKDEIPYFSMSNPIQNFYNQSSNSIQKLLSRNKRRILTEAMQNKQLVVLLAQSTQRSLTKEEKKVVKSQVIDICKTIPSLAIFLLPGGSLLLPILIKFIPTLLPSSFNENLQNEN